MSAKKTRKYNKRAVHPTALLLKNLRKKRGFTQKSLKEALGFKAVSAISKLESRDFLPDLHRLQKLLVILAPTSEEKREILEYYGFSEEDLASLSLGTQFEPQENKIQIFNALNHLFYQFTYYKNYPELIEESKRLYEQEFYIPKEVFEERKHVRMILRMIIDSRRHLAEAMLDNRSYFLEEAQHKANMALELFQLIEQQETQLNWVLQFIKVHAYLCLHACYFKKIIFDENQANLLETLESKYLPEIDTLLKQLKDNASEKHVQELEHVALFAKRELLHVQINGYDRQQTNLLNQIFKNKNGNLCAAYLSSIKKSQATFPKLYNSLFKNREKIAQGKKIYEKYNVILKEHQVLKHWQKELQEKQHAILHTFLAMPPLLAQLKKFELAEALLDIFYFKLDTDQSHYHWHSNYAAYYGLRFIYETQLKHENINLKSQAIYKKMCQHLKEALEFIQYEKAFVDYTYFEEPAFFIVLGYAKMYPELFSNIGFQYVQENFNKHTENI